MTTYGLTKNHEYTQLDVEAQKTAITDKGFNIDPQNWFQVEPDLTRAGKRKWRENLIDKLQPDDQLICFNLATFGGTISSTIFLIDTLLQNNVSIQLIENSTCLSNDQHGFLITLLAETEGELVAAKTIKSKKAIKETGRKGGRPDGKLSTSMLDPHKSEIGALLKNGTSIKSIARTFDCTDTAVHHFIKTRKLKK